MITIKFFYHAISLLIGSSSNYAGDGPTRRYNCLRLNGFYVEKRQGRFYVDEMFDDVLWNKFHAYAIKVGDEVIQLNNIYCEHLGTVAKYMGNYRIKSIQLRSKESGNCYYEQEVENETETIFEQNTQASSSVQRKKRKCRNSKLT